jgi:putative intracellular protease/amidase
MVPVKILVIGSSHDKMGESARKTGVWLEELAAPYYVFKEAGAEITIASPKGGAIPLDPKSLSILIVTRAAKLFLKDEEAMGLLYHSIILEDVKADDFDAVFLPGGHGPMWDIAGNEMVRQLLETFNRQGKPIGAVCHGVVGLMSMKNDAGDLLLKGKRLTAISNSEEESAGLSAIVPFLVETQLLLLGALYSKGTSYVSYVVVDGNIITGQNPASSEETAKRMMSLVHQGKEDTAYYNLSLAK